MAGLEKLLAELRDAETVPDFAVAVLEAAGIVSEIVFDSIFSDGDPTNNGLWPIPPASAEKADEFHWPETESRPDGRDWPVFTGHTYGLGEDV